MKSRKRPIVLIIRDGWGVSEREDGNAVAAASTPVLDSLLEKYPWSLLCASGEDVGLPAEQMGNSEVGHLNIGAGRLVYQEFTRISKAISDREFFQNPSLLAAIKNTKANGSAMHLVGLVSDGGVHSHTDHLISLLKMMKDNDVKNVYLHALLDGRDTSPTGGIMYVAEVEEKMAQIGIGKIATIMGRYYAMDRDNRWERTQRAYRTMTLGEGTEESSAHDAIDHSYKNGVTDEFVNPVIVVDGDKPVATVNDGDSMIFFNFRADRARQLTRCFTDQNFDKFDREPNPRIHFVCLTQYAETINAGVAFPPTQLHNILGEVLGNNGLKQLRIAETEKYAHVTFFFNGGREKPFPDEDRRLIPSPKVPTYDLKPSMSAREVTDEVIKRVTSGTYDTIILNFANPDMVGHTGVFEAAVAAVEHVDSCVGRVVDSVRSVGGVCLITADHGNAEQMIDYETGEVFTAHTINPVHMILVSDDMVSSSILPGTLADIAPTMLHLMGMEQPEEMTGRSLLS